VTIPFAEDTWVRGGTTASTNYADRTLLEICNNDTEQYARWAYLRTDTDAVTGPVSRAVVRLNARMWQRASPMEVYAVPAAWSARSLTWSNRPMPIGGPIAGFTVASTVSEWYEIDVTNHVDQLRRSGVTAVAFLIRQAERNGPVGYVNSVENADFRPHLVLSPSPVTSTTTSTTSTVPPTTSSTTSTTTSTTSTSTTTTTTTSTTTPSVLTTTRVPVGDDSYVRGGSFATTNYGRGSLMQVCNNTNEQYQRDAYLRVPLGAVTTGVDNAILRINARTWNGSASPMALYATESGWTQDALTWTNRPLPSPVALREFIIASGTSTWYELDVTASVAAARRSGAQAVSFVIRQIQRNGPVAYVNSREHSEFRPELVITGIR
jgi:hypothetical protein